MEIIKTITTIPANTGKLMIRIYQKTLSFDHSFWAKPEVYRACIHYPSCSEYTYESIDKFGLIRGSIMGFFRIIRCNPFAKGGYDPVPSKFRVFPKKKD